MAARMKMMKLIQEFRGLAEFNSRHPQPQQAPGLMLLQLRARFNQNRAPRRKLVISVAMQDRPDIPNPVPITHLKPGPRLALAETPAPVQAPAASSRECLQTVP